MRFLVARTFRGSPLPLAGVSSREPVSGLTNERAGVALPPGSVKGRRTPRGARGFCTNGESGARSRCNHVLSAGSVNGPRPEQKPKNKKKQNPEA